MKLRSGFTLLELLIVMAILGVVLTFVVVTNNPDSQNLRADQTTVAQLLERSRTIVRRYSYDVRITVSTDGKSLTAQTYNAAGAAMPEFSKTVQLARAISKNPGLIVTYEAPHARLRLPTGASAVSLEFRVNQRKTFVDLVGVLGKVISRRIE